MLPFLAKVNWKREERRKRRESRVLAMVLAKTIVLKKIDRRGGQRTHEVWKEVTYCEKAVLNKGLRGITEDSCIITKVYNLNQTASTSTNTCSNASKTVAASKIATTP